MIMPPSPLPTVQQFQQGPVEGHPEGGDRFFQQPQGDRNPTMIGCEMLTKYNMIVGKKKSLPSQ